MLFLNTIREGGRGGGEVGEWGPFAGGKFREVKNSRYFKNKFLPMISNEAFRENLTFTNVYFKFCVG